MANAKNIIALLDNIRSRENIGSIFRTADAVGVSKLYLCGITPTPPHEKISKTALGAQFTIPWKYIKQIHKALKKLKKENYHVVALEINKNAKDIFKTKINKKNIALIIGSEVNGISRGALKRADVIVKIPMRGAKESLNVAVAFGIATYQLKK